MTSQEASEKYNIPMRVLREYESWGLCGEGKKRMGSWRYDDSDLERLSIGSDEIEKYMKLLSQGRQSEQERLNMLGAKRRATLDEIHLKEKQLDRLDYLRFEIQKGNPAK